MMNHLRFRTLKIEDRDCRIADGGGAGPVQPIRQGEQVDNDRDNTLHQPRNRAPELEGARHRTTVLATQNFNVAPPPACVYNMSKRGNANEATGADLGMWTPMTFQLQPSNKAMQNPKWQPKKRQQTRSKRLRRLPHECWKHHGGSASQRTTPSLFTPGGGRSVPTHWHSDPNTRWKFSASYALPASPTKSTG